MQADESPPIECLLVEDNPADVRLLREVLKGSNVRCRLHVVGDGEEAMEFLQRRGKYNDAPTPDIILLDLNLPKKDGREVLGEVKKDIGLRFIPIIVLTTSQARDDIVRCYNDHANCYITKPLGFDQFDALVKLIEEFWLRTVKLPRRD